MDKSTILAERLHRQRLTNPLTDADEYIDFFRAMQPVTPIHFSEPGSPPKLAHRVAFDDGPLTNKLRGDRTIVKVRFLHGHVGYIMGDELETYANALYRPMDDMSSRHRMILEAVRSTEPVTSRQLRQETGLKSQYVLSTLVRLQMACLVYEDQIDDDIDRGWYIFSNEWPDIKLNPDLWQESATKVILRFLNGYVFATFEQMKEWSHIQSPRLKYLLRELEAEGQIIQRDIPGLGEGWMRVEDLNLPGRELKPSIFMLHKADTLVRAERNELKGRFGKQEILQYLLIDGEFQGAVAGHWRIGPHDVNDIALTIAPSERAARRDEILKIVSDYYRAPECRIWHYDGQKL